jgi:hypothetical protein
MNKDNILQGIKYGIIAGLVSTVFLDIICLIIFLVMGQSFPAFFALIGRSFLTLVHVDIAFPLWQGLVLHYSIGIITGFALNTAYQVIPGFIIPGYRKILILSMVFTQIEGTTLFYWMSVILDIPQSEMNLIYGLGFILHLIWGASLGTLLFFLRKVNPFPPAQPSSIH